VRPALQGAALLAEDADERVRALELHEKRLPALTGNPRADVLERMARLLPSSEAARKAELLREVVRSHPERRGPLERLIELERSAGRLAQVDELQRALWKIVHDPVERVTLASVAAALQIDEAQNVAAASEWAERADEIASDDAAVQKLRLRIHRRAGNPRRVLDSLEKLAAIEGASTMRLLELAVLYEREGQSEGDRAGAPARERSLRQRGARGAGPLPQPARPPRGARRGARAAHGRGREQRRRRRPDGRARRPAPAGARRLRRRRGRLLARA
jgi:hypothetical protein